MVLSQPDLRAAVERGDIGFDPPLEPDQWGEASVDLRLGFRFTNFARERFEGVSFSIAKGLRTLGRLNIWNMRDFKPEDQLGKKEVFKLEPGEFVLALTYESIRVPRDLIGVVEGRSTYARAGLSMHQTAPWIQPGWNGPIVLEIMNNGPLTIELTPVTDRPYQLSFLRLSTPLAEGSGYGSRPGDRYQGQKHPLVHDRS
jgi:dCTP deaminase